MRTHTAAYAEYRGKRLAQMEESATRLSKLGDEFKSDEYKCDPCQTTFRDEKSWALHMQRHKVQRGIAA